MAKTLPKQIVITAIVIGCAFGSAWGQTTASSSAKEETPAADRASGQNTASSQEKVKIATTDPASIQTTAPSPAKEETPAADRTSGKTTSSPPEKEETAASDPAAGPIEPQQNQDPAPPAKDKDSDKDNTSKPKKPKRGSLVIAPIPIASPALGSGLILAIGYVFKVNQEDKLSPPSTIGLVGARTNGGTRAGGFGGRLYFGENKYQTTLVLAKGHANFDFFGIGRIPGRDPVAVPLEVGGTIFFGEFMRNVWKDVFMGLRFQHRNLTVHLDGPQTPGGFEIPDIDIKGKSVALGFHIQRDKRDSTFYPRRGSLFDVNADFFDQSLGSRRQYQTYKVSYNNYRSIGEKQVLAYRGVVCAANQNVPFYDLCLYGTSNDLRGYAGGEFQNRRMFATQAEYRRELPKRLGVVAFGGIGGVARRWNEFRSDALLPAAGVGLRFKLDKKNHINYRVNWAIGRAGHTLSISIGEAF